MSAISQHGRIRAMTSVGKFATFLLYALLLTVGPALAGSEYLDPQLPGKVPELFAEDEITGDSRVWGVVFTPDLNQVLYNLMERDRTSIMTRKRTGNDWSSPEEVSFTRDHDGMYPALSPDGTRVVFGSSRRPRPDMKVDFLGIWSSARTADAWSEPVLIRSGVSTGIESCPRLTTDGDLYFIRRDEGIMIARKAESGFAPPVSLDDAMNSAYRPGHFFVSSDGTWIVFDSLHGEGHGGMDLYAAFKTPDGSWSAPVNLGPQVNSDAHDSHPTLTPDDRYLIFTSGRNDGRALWWVDSSVVLGIRPGGRSVEVDSADR